MTTSPGNPIISCRVSSKFAFVELRSIEEASNALNLTGIPFMGQCLNISRPSKYRGPTTPARTWQELTGQRMPAPTGMAGMSGMGMGSGIGMGMGGGGAMGMGGGGMGGMGGGSGAAGVDPTTKVYRELYIGNTTPTMTEGLLGGFIAGTMEKVGLTKGAGSPVVHVRNSGNFAFVEFRSVEEASNALCLSGVPFMGQALRISRPSKYPGPQVAHPTWDEVVARFSGATGVGGVGGVGGAAVPPTRVIRLSNMVTAEDLGKDENVDELQEETREECQQFGEVLRVLVPKASAAADPSQAPGVGFVFAEFGTAAAAAVALASLQGRAFDGRKVDAVYWDEAAFARGDLTAAGAVPGQAL